MNYYQFMISRYQVVSQQVRYILFYLILLGTLITGCSIIRNSYPVAFHTGLYFSGWLTWTFGEYMLHRFWQHGQHNSKQHLTIQLHQNHHKHPRELQITFTQRALLGVACIIMIILSFLFNNYISILSGIVFGFALYTFMHWLLHRRWSSFVFPRLHRYHIYHHCKYPNHCHGISVAWWDILFKTTPPEDKKISEKILDFYYGN